MKLSWHNVIGSFDRMAPEGSPRRKLIQILSVVLVFEGFSVLLLFSYQGAAVGIASILLGLFLILLLYPHVERVEKPTKKDSPGIRLAESLVQVIGGGYVVMILGMAIVLFVLSFNRFVSARPSLGDLDTLSILVGATLVVYPLLARKFRVEMYFTLIFLGFVVVFLVVPQAFMSLSSSTGSSVGNWYVHYMLAAPFAGILDLIGIPASSSGNLVTLEFQDGTIHTLGISAYCAGLYSFSIFLSAFFSFVLVFERLPGRLFAIVLGLGLLIAYLGNLVRMVVIGIVGYYRGIDALLWAHENAGWVIFLSWSAVFWYFLLGYVGRHHPTESSSVEAN